MKFSFRECNAELHFDSQFHVPILMPIFLLQYTLSGDQDETLSPAVYPVDVARIEIEITESSGPTSISAVDVLTCCHPKGK